MESESIDLKNESNRLSTFAGWPVSFIIDPKSLAAAGFYYTKHTDKVKCAFCNICICRWEFGDNAIDEHKRHNPNCSFILNQDCGNIPIIEGIQLRGEFVENHKETGQPIDIRGLGVRAHRVAFHLKYNSYCARLKTFRSWRNESQKPEDLATAGFFFTGSNDEVRCYYCDGGLQNWEISDNSWVEHAKWFPNCGFLNLVKGEKFMDESLVERFNALLNRPRSDEPSRNQEVVSIHQLDDESYLSQMSIATERELLATSDIISELLVLPPAIMALELGLQPSQVRRAIRNNLQDIGRPFRSVDDFIQQILSLGQPSFSTDGDSVTLEEVVRRERPMTNISRRQNTLSDESSDSNESDEDVVRPSELNDQSSEDEVLLESQDQIISSSQSENETSSMNESATVADSVDLSQSDNVEKQEEASIPNVNPVDTKLSHSDLEEENRRLKEARLCKICLDQELGVVMLPCAHLVACITCASNLPDCPLCRQTIKATVRTFLS